MILYSPNAGSAVPTDDADVVKDCLVASLSESSDSSIDMFREKMKRCLGVTESG